MLDDDTTSPSPTTAEATEPPARRTRRRAASRPAGPPQPTDTAAATPPPATAGEAEAPEVAPTAKKSTAKKSATKKSAAKKSTTKKSTAKKSTAGGSASQPEPTQTSDPSEAQTSAPPEGQTPGPTEPETSATSAAAPAFTPLFQAPDPVEVVPQKRTISDADTNAVATDGDGSGESRDDDGTGSRRRRSRGGRNRGKSTDTAPPAQSKQSDDDGKHGAKEAKQPKQPKQPKQSKQPQGAQESQASADTKAAKSGEGQAEDSGPIDTDESSGSSRRRRRRRRNGDDSGDSDGDSAGTVVKVREPRAKKEAITSVSGSTRIEAKKQRRREGRDAGRRRPPILSESEFLARRESVDRVMTIRQQGETTQIAVLEDNVLVEHYVALESQNSIIGNVYMGRVQNVLPSMEAAFIDIGKGRNAVLYAGEVNWDLRGDVNQPRRIENALKPGQAVLVQVSKDPVGHKGARLTSQISLPGRYLVYVPGGGTSGISRKLADTERSRLKNLLKETLPDDAGVIIRTAAEGASEEELTRDVTRLTAHWEAIEKKVKSGKAPQLLYAEPDTTLKVVRDLFTEDFSRLVISGDDAWDMVEGYVSHVAPDLGDRLEQYKGDGDVFENFRVEEQISKAMERKVWLPSGGSLVIDRTEAMTVVDVNTGKFTGSGGNLEETVTKNNLEAAEEMVRQLRLRDIGGIIVIDFIDMVLESNRDLVLRRLVECLGRDRTRHQVAEVTSLGLVQMTRKRIGTGLIEAFSHPCETCQGRGVVIESEPVEAKGSADSGNGSSGGRSGSPRGGGSKRSSNRRKGDAKNSGGDSDDARTPQQEPAGADLRPAESHDLESA